MFTTALAITLLAGLSTGIGGVLVALKGDIGDRFLAGALGFSAGVMIYISLVELLPQAMDALDTEWTAILAFFAGVALIAVIDRLVPDDINPHEPGENGALNRGETSGAPTKMLRRAGLMTGIAIALHNFPEGFATFMAAYADPVLAVPIAIAIALHNIPEGVAVAVPLSRATGKRWRAAGWATLSGLAEPAGALIGFALIAPFLGPHTMGYTYAAVAGIMVFISVDKLMPSAIQTGHHHVSVYWMMGGMGLMAASLLMLA